MKRKKCGRLVAKKKTLHFKMLTKTPERIGRAARLVMFRLQTIK